MFDMKENELYDKWVSEALNIFIKTNGGTDEKLKKSLKTDYEISKDELKLFNLRISTGPLIVAICLYFLILIIEILIHLKYNPFVKCFKIQALLPVI